MTITQQREQLQNELNQRIKSGGSQNRLAKQLGINAGTLSFIKNAQWDNISDQMVAKLRAQLRLDNWQLRATQNFNLISKLCEDARTKHRFLAVAGYTGAGKTTALRHYANCDENLMACIDKLEDHIYLIKAFREEL